MLERHNVILIGIRKPIVPNLPKSKIVNTGNINHLLLQCPKWHSFNYDQVLVKGTVASPGQGIRESMLRHSIKNSPSYNVSADYCKLAPELSI